MLVSDQKRQDIKKLNQRADLPKYFRAGAIVALVLTVLAIGVGFYTSRYNTEFRLKPKDAQLSKDVVAEVNGYERTETEGDVKKFYIRADKATTFSDNHQELENVYLEVYAENAAGTDKITARKAIYIPAENKNFTAYFAGDVNIETRDQLKVETEHIYYKKETETAEAEQLVEFERRNVTGKSLGAFVKIKEKRLELTKDVEINAFALDPQDELARSNIQSARITAVSATVDQATEKIELNENVFIGITPTGANTEMSQPTDIKAARAVAAFENREIRQIDLNGSVDVYQKPTGAVAKWTRTKADRATARLDKELKRLELIDNVRIETTTGDAKPTVIDSGFAVYEKDADRFELKNGVNIVTVEDELPTRIKSSEAVYEQAAGRIYLFGGGEIDNGREYLKGDNLTAQLYPNKKIRASQAKGNAYLKQNSPERVTEISAAELNAAFNESQHLQTANALGSANAVLTPSASNEYSKVTMAAPQAIRVTFREAGLLEQMLTEGRTTILLNAPAGRPDAANKKLTADQVKTFFNQTGKDLQKAEAVGNAELHVEPLQARPENYRTTVNAPRFDCEFFPTGNNARLCIAQTKTKTVRVPTVPAATRGEQTLLADQLNALFNPQNQDIQQLDAVGGTKFTELDRNGIAERIQFTQADETVRLRGGEPTVWDSRARVKAPEIDWNTRDEKSFLRGGVATTYYNQKQTGGATPFGATTKPVFVTAASAEFDHAAETGLYTGNARAWQENNYVRSDRLLLKQKEGELHGEGTVQSALYNVKRKENGRESTVPVYATSNKIFYNRDKRVLRYEDAVDIRQATDRITAGVADIYLNERNEMSQTVAERDVVITQPNRRAAGSWAQYTAETEVAVLRGNPARVEDGENGTSQGAEMTVFLRDNRVVTEAKTEQNNTGRIRSVYKVKKNE